MIIINNNKRTLKTIKTLNLQQSDPRFLPVGTLLRRWFSKVPDDDDLGGLMMAFQSDWSSDRQRKPTPRTDHVRRKREPVAH